MLMTKHHSWPAAALGKVMSMLCRAANLRLPATRSVAIAVLCWSFSNAAAQTVLVSKDALGEEGNGLSNNQELSFDGRYVLFQSSATSLVSHDTNGVVDVFVHDRDWDGNGVFDEDNGRIVRLSVSSTGTEANGLSGAGALSGNGRFAFFYSQASNLVAGDTNAATDVFLHDRDPDGNGIYDEGNGAISLVSCDSAGIQGNDESGWTAASLDGRHVAFSSNATNLVPGDSNNSMDVFARDLLRGITVRVSVSSSGLEGDQMSWRPSISEDGRFVAFTSRAANLVPGDTNGWPDAFVHDRDPDRNGIYDEGNGVTMRATVSSTGEEGVRGGEDPVLSGNARDVAFHSSSRNLVSGDTNGEEDVFVHDRDPDGNGIFDEGNGKTVRVSVNSRGEEADRGSNLKPAISSSGRFVAFGSYARNLVPGDTNGDRDIFVRDRDPDGNGVFNEPNDITRRASIRTDGTEANFYSYYSPTLSTNERYVGFSSGAWNLWPGDTNTWDDVFVHTLDSGVRVVFVGVPRHPNPVHFEAQLAYGETGSVALVLLSVSGTAGFPLPDGRTVPLTFDSATAAGLSLWPLFSATIDANGQGATTSFKFPLVAPGTTLYASTVTLDATLQPVSVSQAITIVAQ